MPSRLPVTGRIGLTSLIRAQGVTALRSFFMQIIIAMFIELCVVHQDESAIIEESKIILNIDLISFVFRTTLYYKDKDGKAKDTAACVICFKNLVRLFGDLGGEQDEVTVLNTYYEIATRLGVPILDTETALAKT